MTKVDYDALLSTQGAKDIASIGKTTESIVALLSQGWSKSELEGFNLALLHDATRENISKYIEGGKTLEDLHNALPILQNKFFWTKGEIQLLEANLDEDPSVLWGEFPLRARTAVNQKIQKLRKHQLQQEKITTTKHKQSTPAHDQPRKKHKGDIDEQEDLLHYCINDDLTLESIKNFFPNEAVSDVVKKIQERFGPLDEIPVTVGEKQLIKDTIKSKASLDSVSDQFPCRSREFLEEKFKEQEFVSTRRTKFKSGSERLLYEAKWCLYSTGETFSTSRRSRKRALEESFETMEQEILNAKPVEHVELTPEELQERERRREIRKEGIRIAKERREKEKQKAKEEYERKKAAGLIKPKGKSEKSYAIKDLLAGSEHFQSVIGDRKKVEEGQKRKRVQAVHFQPEIQQKRSFKLKVRYRQAEKSKIKQALKLKKQQDRLKEKAKRAARKKTTKKKKKTRIENEESASPDIEDLIKEEEEEEEEEVEEEDEDSYSPYDPIDINSDSFVPLKGRQFYIKEVYDETPLIPELNFVDIPEESETSFLSRSTMTETKKVMTKVDDKIVYDDNLAADIVRSHVKNYRDLPISFPPLLDPSSANTKIYPTNKVRIRFLLYPQHFESFILAAPKSNELDPIYEIIKLLMIHYALYFSHSPEIRRIITEEYCQKIEHSIEENDFGDFMFIIDKWNSLMLKLSPNVTAVETILKEGSEDINKELRSYLGESEIRVPTSDDLKLQAFFEAIILEDLSPAFQLVKNESADDSATEEFVPKHSGDVEAPTNVTDELKDIKPDDYNVMFFNRLKEKTEISRFTTQQLLLRVYSRIVSTDSRKLRSYKAFTAEVYGELLPSFTSEVLEKVNLLPTQKFYDLGSGVGNTTFQAALEYGASVSGGCELMEHASMLTTLQEGLLQKHLAVFGLKALNLDFALSQSFVDNDPVRAIASECEVLIINNYLFDGNLNAEVGRLLLGLSPGTKIVSLRNFISPRYRATGDTVFDYFKVEKHEMSDFLSVSWTANKVPYYISTVQERILPEYLGKEESPDSERSSPSVKSENGSSDNLAGTLTPFTATPEPDMFKDLSCVLDDDDVIVS
ncbi:histone methylation protein DOT1-domain-containing protein [Scheffersomyces xylosifermentans]|uniref:histone methylation protein DOT1-domain-containing protein n=1 Tax=Scheffersomyces xylosifermentans TaxID=1304137 RepID=UPI00315D050D